MSNCGPTWMIFSAICAANCLLTSVSLAAPPETRVVRCEDFDVMADGIAAEWSRAAEVSLNRRGSGKLEYSAAFRMMYSRTGVYVLFSGSDQRLSATMTEDFADLWNEDVFECFFWPDERHPVYFEYEISPLGYELPILVPKLDGQFSAGVHGTMKGLGRSGRMSSSPVVPRNPVQRSPAGRQRCLSPTNSFVH